MAVTSEVKEFCAHNLVAIIMQDIKEYFKEMTDEELLSDFTASVTYSKLFGEKNGLWAEGPDYILNMYLEEKECWRMGERNISERKRIDITRLQSECVTGYSKYANIPITESSKLFTEYNLFEFIKNCYDVLHLDDVDYVIENDIAKRISGRIYYHSDAETSSCKN